MGVRALTAPPASKLDVNRWSISTWSPCLRGNAALPSGSPSLRVLLNQTWVCVGLHAGIEGSRPPSITVK